MIRVEYATPTRRAFPVKRISVKQSRNNSAERRRKVMARQAKAGHWTARSKPVFGSSRVHYEVGAYGSDELRRHTAGGHRAFAA